MKKKKKRMKRNRQIPFIISGLLLISFSFVLSLRALSDQRSPDNAYGQQVASSYSEEEFISRLLPHAQELQAGYGVLPSIIIGQAILESNWGTSQLASHYFNLFGIKAYGDARKVTLDTQEFFNEQWVVIQGDFRVYDSWEESMDDHTKLFINGVDWDPNKYAGVLTATNYQEAAHALQLAGYATDPNYAEKVIHVIETYQLYQYD
ncbi:glycoside hydrolase family 73 protein [Enterococcus lemanii]|uniref:Glycoside hydrolase family 73 protein n=1 Tax=Enterococcus lemanii TaxID=1159752 RepID=A0ABV9MWZ0_9ENTE|nr:glycoside hydrolase family 73 protein [Enterococcus lemanii]MBM7707968.1 flagellum-specific peptidoglycan hydrolase FlgJ [Enterococcus lemanii]